MKLLLRYAILLFTIISTTSCATAPVTTPNTETQVQRVQYSRLQSLYKKLQLVDNHYSDNIDLQFEHGTMNARTFPPTGPIAVDADWLSRLPDTEAMLIMGHEMGHNHYEVMNSSSDSAVEMAADVYGAKMLLKMGYSKAQVMVAAELFFRAPFTRYSGDNVHPSGQIRYDNIKQAVDRY